MPALHTALSLVSQVHVLSQARHSQHACRYLVFSSLCVLDICLLAT